VFFEGSWIKHGRKFVRYFQLVIFPVFIVNFQFLYVLSGILPAKEKMNYNKQMDREKASFALEQKGAFFRLDTVFRLPSNTPDDLKLLRNMV